MANTNQVNVKFTENETAMVEELMATYGIRNRSEFFRFLVRNAHKQLGVVYIPVIGTVTGQEAKVEFNNGSHTYTVRDSGG